MVDTSAIAHVVVTEGLACDLTSQQYGLSDYFVAVLDKVAQVANVGAVVFIAPGNKFGCELSEEDYAKIYLSKKRPDLKIYVPLNVCDRPYLDTFDNARLLQVWLQRQHYPLKNIYLYCNQPHCFRSALLFRLCGFQVTRVIGSYPTQITRKIVNRLWFYDYPGVQFLYEIAGLVYDLNRWLLWTLAR
jgi:hypothetical protein